MLKRAMVLGLLLSGIVGYEKMMFAGERLPVAVGLLCGAPFVYGIGVAALCPENSIVDGIGKTPKFTVAMGLFTGYISSFLIRSGSFRSEKGLLGSLFGGLIGFSIFSYCKSCFLEKKIEDLQYASVQGKRDLSFYSEVMQPGDGEHCNVRMVSLEECHAGVEKSIAELREIQFDMVRSIKALTQRQDSMVRSLESVITFITDSHSSEQSSVDPDEDLFYDSVSSQLIDNSPLSVSS